MDVAFETTLYPAAVRWVVALLRALAALTVLAVAALTVMDIVTGELVMPPGRAARALVAWALLPLAVARALAWLERASLVVEGQVVALITRRQRHEIPREAIAAVRPWRLPLPSVGLTLETRSGRRFGLATREVGRLLAALGGADLPRLLVYAEARERARPSVARLALKYVLFPVLPALVVFHLHQVIAYGSPLGQYYLMGGRAWALTLVKDWVATLAQLVPYAGAWRAAGELVAMAGTAVAPRRALPLRTIVEWALAIAYYVGVPALIAARLVA